MTEPLFVEGLPMTGELIKNFEIKKFVILGARYEEALDYNTKQPYKRVVLSVEVNKIKFDWYPNKSAIKKLAALRGMNMLDWIGYAGEFQVIPQMVQGQVRDVVHIKETA